MTGTMTEPTKSSFRIEAMQTPVAKEQSPLAIRRLDDERRVLMLTLGVVLKQDLAVMIHQGEPDKDFIPAVAIDVGDGGVMAGVEPV